MDPLWSLTVSQPGRAELFIRCTCGTRVPGVGVFLFEGKGRVWEPPASVERWVDIKGGQFKVLLLLVYTQRMTQNVGVATEVTQ